MSSPQLQEALSRKALRFGILTLSDGSYAIFSPEGEFLTAFYAHPLPGLPTPHQQRVSILSQETSLLRQRGEALGLLPRRASRPIPSQTLTLEDLGL